MKETTNNHILLALRPKKQILAWLEFGLRQNNYVHNILLYRRTDSVKIFPSGSWTASYEGYPSGSRTASYVGYLSGTNIYLLNYI